MGRTKRNIVANLIGNVWIIVVSTVFVPFYIHFMGIESYGLIGFFAALQAVLILLDLGFMATVSREISRLSVKQSYENEIEDYFVTLEVVYSLLSIAVVVIVALIAPWLADTWINTETFTHSELVNVILLMGIVIAFRLQSGFYNGAMQGFQQQVALNLLRSSITTLQNAGVVLVLWLVSPTLISFFTWFALIGFAGMIFMALLTRRYLPAGRSGKFSWRQITRTWQFTGGMFLISLLSVVVAQADKFIVTKALSLEIVGYYMLATTVARVLPSAVAPIFSALYPRFTQLVEEGNQVALIAIYHKGCQLATLLLMPLAIIICLYSEPLLELWVQNSVTAENSAPILSILIVGTALNGVMHIPYALQLAHGWTKLSVFVNSISLILLVPLFSWAISKFGVIGAAMVMLAINFIPLLIGVSILHKRYLIGEFQRWLIRDLFFPSGLALLPALLAWSLLPGDLSMTVLIFWIIIAYIISAFFCLLGSTEVRQQVYIMIFKGKIIHEG